ncbi:MAG: class I SAM-dependent methyltransferase [Microthrixaceae bacterium]
MEAHRVRTQHDQSAGVGRGGGDGTAAGDSIRIDSPLVAVVESLLGDRLPVAVATYDGGYLGPADPPATVEVRSADALRRLLTAPGELGFARAYVSGDITIEGDIYAVLGLRDRMPSPRLGPQEWMNLLRILGTTGMRPLRPPAEEHRPSGRLHSLRRDRAAVSHHYDVSNDFYELVLGPAMTYSCALFSEPDYTLERAQAAKLELVCQKLALGPGMRMLDVGCGWGSMVMHAAAHHGVEALGVTISSEQADWARGAVLRAGLEDRVEIRLCDYRELRGERFDAISSIGMSEHVGASQMDRYFSTLAGLVEPGGRVLNHAISRPPGSPPAIGRRSFVGRYVFPDGELVEVGQVITAMQEAGLEAVHMENLREHYALTLREWVSNLESNWDRCAELAGEARARIWRLYMAGSALGFEEGRIAVNQVLGVPAGSTGVLPRRPDWDTTGS